MRLSDGDARAVTGRYYVVKRDAVNSLGRQFHAAVLGAVLRADPRRLDAARTQTLPQSPARVSGSALAAPFAVPQALPVPLLGLMMAGLRLLFRRGHGLLRESSGRVRRGGGAAAGGALGSRRTFFSVFFSRLLTCLTFTAFFLSVSS